MLILTIRTDKPEAEIGLFDDSKQLAYETWLAHRELSSTIHQKIEDILTSQHKKVTDLGGIVCFAGPGSFTGLRIGITVGNTLAYGLTLPAVGSNEEAWIQAGITRLLKGDQDRIVLPEYGAPVNITLPKR